MISPSPTQQQPSPPSPERVQPVSTPIRRRTGQTPAARFFKAVLRPLFKVFYYVINGIRTHRLLTLLAIVLLLASVSVTLKLTTGTFPFGIGSDPFNFQTNGSAAPADHIKNWLYALRDGNATEMSLIQQEMIMSQPPDVNAFISQYSQTQGHVTWKNITVIGTYNESDTSTDTFVEVDVLTKGPGGNVPGIMVWHFETYQGRILSLDLISGAPRATLPGS